MSSAAIYRDEPPVRRHDRAPSGVGSLPFLLNKIRMKNIRPLLLIVALSPTALLLSACSKSDDIPPAVQSTKADAQELATDVKVAASDSWDAIKDYTYEKRADFAASLDRLSEKRDADIQAMNAKLKGLPDAAAQKRDQAVKEFNEARSYLKSQLADLRTGTADTWTDAKGKVAESWLRVQAAYEKVTSSPTS
jgi:hypothetical protein